MSYDLRDLKRDIREWFTKTSNQKLEGFVSRNCGVFIRPNSTLITVSLKDIKKELKNRIKRAKIALILKRKK